MDYFTLVGFNLLPIASLLFMNMRIIMTLRRVVDEDSRRDEEITRLADGTLVQVLPFPMFELILTLIPSTDRVSSLFQEPASHRLNANAMLFAVVFMLLICVGPQVRCPRIPSQLIIFQALARLLFDLYGQYHSTAIVYTCVTQQVPYPFFL